MSAHNYRHVNVDTIRPDFPAEARVYVVAHFDALPFVALTAMEGSRELWSVDLDRDQAETLAEALRHAVSRSWPDAG